MIDARVCFWCARMCASHLSRRFNYSACIKSSFLQPSEPAHLMVNTNEYCIFPTKPRVRGKKTDAESLREKKKKMTAVGGMWVTLPSVLKEGKDKQKRERREEWKDGVPLRIAEMLRRRGERPRGLLWRPLSQDQPAVSGMSPFTLLFYFSGLHWSFFSFLFVKPPVSWCNCASMAHCLQSLDTWRWTLVQLELPLSFLSF